MSVEKLAVHELKQLLKLHSSYIYAWANETKSHFLPSPEAKEGMLEVCARLYECLEALPTSNEPIKPEGKK